MGESREDNIDKAEGGAFSGFVGSGQSMFTGSTQEEKRDDAEVKDCFCLVVVGTGFKFFCEALEEGEVGGPDPGGLWIFILEAFVEAAESGNEVVALCFSQIFAIQFGEPLSDSTKGFVH